MASQRKRRTTIGDTSAKKPKFTETRKVPSSLADIEVISAPSRTPSPSPVEVRQVSNGRPVLADDLSDDSDTVVHDICFGLIVMEVTGVYKTWNPPPESSPVRISFKGNALLLRFEDGGGSAGVLISEPLSRLVRECSVTLAASLGPPILKPPKFTISSTFRPRPVRIVIYGHLEEKDTVASILDEGGVFLQRPDEAEYDLKTTYLNPMYLLPPGETMPTIRTSSATTGLGRNSTSLDGTELSDAQRLRALRIFDEASGVDGTLPLEVEQSPRIVSKLKNHQIEALAMMLEKEQGPLNGEPRFPSLWETFSDDGKTRYRHAITKCRQSMPLPDLRGGILADEMGLGKTLSILALICHCLDQISEAHSLRVDGIPRASLIVAPKSTIYGWQQQMERHIRSGAIRSLLYHGPKRQEGLDEDEFDVVLTTYETLRSDWTVQGPLYTRKWARIILDEGHKIRNSSSQIFHAAREVPAQNRWCLTGTPIQNSLYDFGSLLAFVGVPPFTTREQFKFWIANPILSNRVHSLRVLRTLVRATCLRRTKAVPALAEELRLSRKSEHVKFVDLSPDEREIYEFFKRRSYLLADQTSAARPQKAQQRRRKKKEISATDALKSPKSTGNIIVLISILRLICDHGAALLPRSASEAWHNRDSQAVGWAMLQTAARAAQRCLVCGRQVDDDVERFAAEVVEYLCKEHVVCGDCMPLGEDEKSATCPECLSSPASASPGNFSPSYAPSSKISALLGRVLSTIQKNKCSGSTDSPIKSVVFSNWTGMLDMILEALSPHLLSHGVTSVRIDGSFTLQQRRDALDRFNSDDSCVVMLATIGAVSEGIDLSVASEVHLVEPHWNPMAEAQAVDRVHRIGQSREVNVTRYCVSDSIEEYIQWIQGIKLRLITESLSSSEHGKGKGKEKDEEKDLGDVRWKRLLEFLQ